MFIHLFIHFGSCSQTMRHAHVRAAASNNNNNNGSRHDAGAFSHLSPRGVSVRVG